MEDTALVVEMALGDSVVADIFSLVIAAITEPVIIVADRVTSLNFVDFD